MHDKRNSASHDAPAAYASAMTPQARPRSVCEHLALAPTEYRVRFTGEGVTRDWVCAACAQAHPAAPSLRAIDDAWWTANADDMSCEGVVGSPEVRERATSLAFEHEDVAVTLHAEFVDMQPCVGSAPAVWVLVAGGALRRVDLATAAVTHALAPADLGFEVNAGCGLCLSPVDDYGAVYEASGSRGAVIDLRDGRVVRRLEPTRPRRRRRGSGLVCTRVRADEARRAEARALPRLLSRESLGLARRRVGRRQRVGLGPRRRRARVDFALSPRREGVSDAHRGRRATKPTARCTVTGSTPERVGCLHGSSPGHAMMRTHTTRGASRAAIVDRAVVARAIRARDPRSVERFAS